MQQVLGYLNGRHGGELKKEGKGGMLVRARSRDEDLSEGSPDYLADETVPTDIPSNSAAPANAASTTAQQPAAEEARKPKDAGPTVATATVRSAPPALPLAKPAVARAKATVVLDVGNGAIVPDFRGLSMRAALEAAQSAGVQLGGSGSGAGREQAPPAESRIQAGGGSRGKGVE